MNPVEIIRKKRDGLRLERAEIGAFVQGYLEGTVADYQMSAWLMAVFFAGMDHQEAHDLTEIMMRSGMVIDLSSIPGRKVDKHSTGGVGDKVSLIVTPMVASCGVPVPMVSGRGLGHTGGTLDKLESIPGFRTDLTVEEYRRAVAKVGAAMIGQTSEVVPADRKLYALRDVTATVESIPLIGGSIMSKKLAEGIDALVLDVKTGNGAFMQTEEEAGKLARTLVEIGTRFGKETVAFLTTADEPLGYAVGNWLEVAESLACLRGANVPDLMEICYVLGGAMVHLGGKAGTIEEGMKLCRSALWSGKAYGKFLEIVAHQGGETRPLKESAAYPTSKVRADVLSRSAGFVTGFRTREIGVLSTELGAGRLRLEDSVDPKAGILFRKKIGDRVQAGEVLATIHTDRDAIAEEACRTLEGLIQIGEQEPYRRPALLAVVDKSGMRPWKTPVQY